LRFRRDGDDNNNDNKDGEAMGHNSAPAANGNALAQPARSRRRKSDSLNRRRHRGTAQNNQK